MSLSLHQGNIDVDMYNTLKGTRLFHYCFQCSLYFSFHVVFSSLVDILSEIQFLKLFQAIRMSGAQIKFYTNFLLTFLSIR